MAKCREHHRRICPTMNPAIDSNGLHCRARPIQREVRMSNENDVAASGFSIPETWMPGRKPPPKSAPAAILMH